MARRNINLAENQVKKVNYQKTKNKSSRHRLVKFFILVIIPLFIILNILSAKAVRLDSDSGGFFSRLPVVSKIQDVFTGGSKLVDNGDRLNILLLGIGGGSHDGGLLTDTIMIGSIDLKTNATVLTSIPRDLLVKIHDNGYERINTANAYGEMNDFEGGGSALVAKTIEDTFQIPIHYWLRVDFSGFEDVVNRVGGIDIYIEKSFEDKSYPTSDHGIKTVSFEKGWEHMDGQRALIFARSRHGNNGEGSDFARSKRQQKIIFALKEKLTNKSTFASPKKIFGLIEDFRNNIQTNINLRDSIKIYSLIGDIETDKIEHYVIDDSPGGLLKPIITDSGAFVLVPKSGDLNDLQEYMQNLFTIKEIQDEDVGVIVVNGTTIEGLATYTGSILSSWGFEIDRLATSPDQNFEKTVIYNLDNKELKNSESITKILKNRFGANTASEVPAYLEDLKYKDSDITKPLGSDFMVVIGEDQQRSIEALKKWRAEEMEREARRRLEAEKEKAEEAIEEGESE